MSTLYFARTYGLRYNHMIVSKSQKKANQGLEKWWDKEYKGSNGRSFKEAADYHGFVLNSSVISASGKSIILDIAFDI